VYPRSLRGRRAGRPRAFYPPFIVEAMTGALGGRELSLSGERRGKGSRWGERGGWGGDRKLLDKAQGKRRGDAYFYARISCSPSRFRLLDERARDGLRSA